MKKHMPLLVATLLAAGFAAPSFADKEGKGKQDPEARFQKLDSNGDGKLTLDEFKAGMKNPDRAEKLFKKLDANGDGVVTLDEYKAGAPGKKKQD